MLFARPELQQFIDCISNQLLVAVSSSAPLKVRDTRSLHLDDMGAYFRMVFKEIGIARSTLNLEVRDSAQYEQYNFITILQLKGTVFVILVCPLFIRMQQTLLSLSESDW